MNLEIFPLVSEASPRHTLRLTFRVEGSLDGKAIEWMVSHPPPKSSGRKAHGIFQCNNGTKFLFALQLFSLIS